MIYYHFPRRLSCANRIKKPTAIRTEFMVVIVTMLASDKNLAKF